MPDFPEQPGPWVRFLTRQSTKQASPEVHTRNVATCVYLVSERMATRRPQPRFTRLHQVQATVTAIGRGAKVMLRAADANDL